MLQKIYFYSSKKSEKNQSQFLKNIEQCNFVFNIDIN